MNRYVAIVCWCVCSLSALWVGNAAHAAETVTLIAPGRAAVLVLPAGKVDGDTQAAANLIQEYVQRSTHVALTVVREDAPLAADQPAIFLGRGTQVNQLLGAQLDQLDVHGFVLRGAGTRAYVAGRTGYGTWCAATEFLRRTCGVEWYMPGPLWEVVKPQAGLQLPAGDLVINPTFRSRHHSGHRHPLEHRWLRMHGSVHRYDFHHAAGRWSGAEPLARFKDQPELFGLVNGRRMVPGQGSIVGWQVCMSNPKVFDLYAQMADAYFTQHAEVMSFSVTPNDGDSFCECANCQKFMADVPEDRRANAGKTALVFHMVNEVAKRLAAKWPDRFVGILAYSSYREPLPGLRVEPNVLVCQVGCRSTYGDAASQAGYVAMLDAWKAAGAGKLALYEWHHGSFFSVPVLYPHLLAQAMRDGVARGADGWYSEDYPAWGMQGPAHWIVARLLWDVNQDVDALLDQYCRDLFGPAAGSMGQYFKRCEEQWNAHGGGGGRGSDAQFGAYPPAALAELRGLLTQAAKEAATAEPAGTRVRFFAAALGLTERMIPRHTSAVLAAQRIESGDLAGAMEAIAAASDPQRDPLHYLQTVLDPLPLVYYYRSDTVDRHFTAGESGLLRAKIALVDRVTALLRPRVAALDSVSPKAFGGLLQDAMVSGLPTGTHPNMPFLTADIHKFAGKHVMILAASTAPVIDGKLDDPAWQEAAVQSGFFSHGSGRPARHETHVRTVWHADRLYVSAQCFQNMTKPKATAGARDGNAWLDDALELHINLGTDDQPQETFVVVVNVAGQVFDMKRRDPKWDGDIQTGTALASDHWSLEFSVPLSDLDVDAAHPRALRLNFVRDAWGAYTGGEISSWFPVVFATQDPNIRGWGFFAPASR